jgi:hypothetical protein
VLFALAGSAVPASAVTVGGVRILDPGSEVSGRSIGEIAANWWRFALETPIPSNPVYGAPHRRGPLGDENIAFLYTLPVGGGVGTYSARVRTTDTALLPLRPWVNARLDQSVTAQDLLDQLDPLVGTIRNLSVEINGVDLASASGLDLIATYRERFPGPGDTPFGITLPDQDAYAGLNGLVSDLMVIDGHWGALRLPLGDHRISIRWDAVDDQGVVVDSLNVAHEISVVPLPAPLALILGGLAALAGVGATRSRAARTRPPGPTATGGIA